MLRYICTMSQQEAFVQFAKSLGFFEIGFAKLRSLDEEEDHLKQWLQKSYHGSMEYMERYTNLRLDPRLLVPGSESVIVLLYNYYQEPVHANKPIPKIARYAQGNDYHKVLRKKIKSLGKWLQEHAGAKVFRGFVDSGPVMERQWAREAGLSWNGRNTLAIHPKHGSYFFIACLFTDVVFDYGSPMPDYCGTCKRCVEACPTKAIDPKGYLLNASKCISYFTIESKSPPPESYRGNFDQWIFGCDICQEVCPWNRFSSPHNEPAFLPPSDHLNKTLDSWLNVLPPEFDHQFRDSSLRRKGLTGLQQTARFLKDQSGD